MAPPIRDQGNAAAEARAEKKASLCLLIVDEKVALAALLMRTIADDRYSLSPRVGTCAGILAKLELAKQAPAPLPPQRVYAPPGRYVGVDRLRAAVRIQLHR